MLPTPWNAGPNGRTSRTDQIVPFVLSLVVPGLGHVRRGQIKTGLVFATLHGGIAGVLTMYVLLIPATDPWYVLPFFAALFGCTTIYLANIVSVLMSAHHRDDRPTRMMVIAGVTAILLVYSPSVAVLIVLWAAPTQVDRWLD